MSIAAIMARAGQLAQRARAVGSAIRATRLGRAATGVGIAAGVGAGSALLTQGVGEMLSEEPRRRRRSRGISARDYRVTQRTLRKITKMYAKLPKRSSRAVRVGRSGKSVDIVNVD